MQTMIAEDKQLDLKKALSANLSIFTSQNIIDFLENWKLPEKIENILNNTWVEDTNNLQVMEKSLCDNWEKSPKLVAYQLFYKWLHPELNINDLDLEKLKELSNDEIIKNIVIQWAEKLQIQDFKYDTFEKYFSKTPKGLFYYDVLPSSQYVRTDWRVYDWITDEKLKLVKGKDEEILNWYSNSDNTALNSLKIIDVEKLKIILDHPDLYRILNFKNRVKNVEELDIKYLKIISNNEKLGDVLDSKSLNKEIKKIGKERLKLIANNNKLDELFWYYSKADEIKEIDIERLVLIGNNHGLHSILKDNKVVINLNKLEIWILKLIANNQYLYWILKKAETVEHLKKLDIKILEIIANNKELQSILENGNLIENINKLEIEKLELISDNDSLSDMLEDKKFENLESIDLETLKIIANNKKLSYILKYDNLTDILKILGDEKLELFKDNENLYRIIDSYENNKSQMYVINWMKNQYWWNTNSSFENLKNFDIEKLKLIVDNSEVDKDEKKERDMNVFDLLQDSVVFERLYELDEEKLALIWTHEKLGFILYGNNGDQYSFERLKHLPTEKLELIAINEELDQIFASEEMFLKLRDRLSVEKLQAVSSNQSFYSILNNNNSFENLEKLDLQKLELVSNNKDLYEILINNELSEKLNNSDTKVLENIDSDTLLVYLSSNNKDITEDITF